MSCIVTCAVEGNLNLKLKTAKEKLLVSFQVELVTMQGFEISHFFTRSFCVNNKKLFSSLHQQKRGDDNAIIRVRGEIKRRASVNGAQRAFGNQSAERDKHETTFRRPQQVQLVRLSDSPKREVAKPSKKALKLFLWRFGP